MFLIIARPVRECISSLPFSPFQLLVVGRRSLSYGNLAVVMVSK